MKDLTKCPYPCGPDESPMPECWDGIEPCLSGASIEDLRRVSRMIDNMCSNMSEELNKTITVDDFKKKMKSHDESGESYEPNESDKGPIEGEMELPSAS